MTALYTSVRAKSLLTLATVAAVLTSSVLALAQAAPTTAPATTGPATTTTAPLVRGPVLATINGQDISREEFERVLMFISGVRLFDQVVSLVVAEKACTDAGIDLTKNMKEMMQAEKDRILAELGNQGVPPEKRDAVFMNIMQRQGATPMEIDMTLRRAACLRALAKGARAQGQFTVTDDQVKQAYESEYGPKVQVRDIVVKDMSEGAEVAQAVSKQGKNIMDVVMEKGLPSQALVISENAPVASAANPQALPKQIKDSAFQLKEKEISSVIPVEGPNGQASYHILYIEKKMARQTDKPFASVEAKLRQDLWDAAERNWANQHLARLRANAKIDIKDPILSQAYYELSQRAGAATQPATAPAIPSATRPAAPAAAPK